jgi:hypothetical protein
MPVLDQPLCQGQAAEPAAGDEDMHGHEGDLLLILAGCLIQPAEE